MNKLLLLVSTFLLTLGLVACSETEENLSGKVDNSKTEESNTEEENKTDGEENEINEVIVDNDNVKATLIKIVKKDDPIFGKSVEVVFDVQNKRNESIEVQARSVSVDDVMVDEALLTMSQEVAPGKSAKAILSIYELEDYDFPEFKNNFEMELLIFSWDNIDYEEKHPVKVTF